MKLEQGLKRLLRSLNHTIIWESDKIITIMVFGKSDPGRSGPAISYQSPPQTYPEETEPAAETESASLDAPEPADTVVEAADSDAADQDEANREPGDDASTPGEDTLDESSAEPVEGSPSAPDAPTDGAGDQN